MFKCGHTVTPENSRKNGVRNGRQAYRCATCHPTQNHGDRSAANRKYREKNRDAYNAGQAQWARKNRATRALRMRLKAGWPHDVAMLKPLKRVERKLNET